MSKALTITQKALQQSKSAIANAEEGFLKHLSSSLGAEEKLDIFQQESFWFNNAVQKNPSLGFCTQASMVSALVQVSLIPGMTLNPTYKYGYLVSRNVKVKDVNGKDKWEKRMCFDPSYMGMIYVLKKVGAVVDIKAGALYESDELDYLEGTGSYFKLKKNIRRTKDEYPIAGYAWAELPNGTDTFELLPMVEIEAIMEDSEGYKNKKGEINIYSPWVKNVSSRDQMIGKTGVRRLFKRLAMAEGADHLLRSFDMSNNPSGIVSPDPLKYQYTEPLPNEAQEATAAAQEEEQSEVIVMDANGNEINTQPKNTASDLKGFF